MPKVSPIQAAFNAGEISPLMYGRPDINKYRLALQTMLNFKPLVQGGMARREGSVFVAEVKTSSKKTRMVRFEFSTTQAYMIEFGDLYCRFYKDGGRIESPPGTPVEIVTPYAEADLFQLKFSQSADVLYVAHPTYAPRKITRTSHTAWTINAITFLDGPYLSVNTTATTITPSATTGAITLTASTSIFVATDVGRLVRIKHGTTWGYATITGYTSGTVVNATVNSAFGAATAQASWRLGTWGATTGYPGAVAFFEDRLFWGGCTSYPQRLDGSKSGDYENMAPSGTDGTVAADNAVAVSLNSNDVNVIRWLLDDEKGLLIGTVGGEWILRPSTTSEALSPTNIKATRSTTYGSANVQAVRAGKACLYIQRAGRKLRELAYVFEVDGFRSPNMTLLSEHITLGGVTELAYQQEPESLLWMVRGDGTLLSLTYDRDQDVIGWARHVIGGAFGSGQAVVESVATIPAPAGNRDETWLIVKRTVDGNTKRYVEYLSKPWERGDVQEDAIFVDSALTYSGAAADVISGLDHLEGETVSILAEGAVHPDKVVVSGSITLDREVTKAQIGLPYTAKFETLRIEAGAADGTAQGKTKRIHRLGVRFHDALGIELGPDFDNLDPVVFRSSSDAMDTAVPLFSGDISLNWDDDYSTEGQVCGQVSQPFPCTVLDLMPQLVTQDRG